MIKKKIIRYNIRLVNEGIKIPEEVDLPDAVRGYRGRIICQFVREDTKPPSPRFLYMYFMVEPLPNNDVYASGEYVFVRFPMDEMDIFIDVLRNEGIVYAIFDNLIDLKMVGIESGWRKKPWIYRIFP